MTGFGCFNNSTCSNGVLNLLDTDYLRPMEVVVKRIIVINFGVDDGCGSGTDCRRSEVRADTKKLMNIITEQQDLERDEM